MRIHTYNYFRQLKKVSGLFALLLALFCFNGAFAQCTYPNDAQAQQEHNALVAIDAANPGNTLGW